MTLITELQAEVVTIETTLRPSVERFGPMDLEPVISLMTRGPRKYTCPMATLALRCRNDLKKVRLRMLGRTLALMTHHAVRIYIYTLHV